MHTAVKVTLYRFEDCLTVFFYEYALIVKSNSNAHRTAPLALTSKHLSPTWVFAVSHPSMAATCVGSSESACMLQNPEKSNHAPNFPSINHTHGSDIRFLEQIIAIDSPPLTYSVQKTALQVDIKRRRLMDRSLEGY